MRSERKGSQYPGPRTRGVSGHGKARDGYERPERQENRTSSRSSQRARAHQQRAARRGAGAQAEGAVDPGAPRSRPPWARVGSEHRRALQRGAQDRRERGDCRAAEEKPAVAGEATDEQEEERAAGGDQQREVAQRAKRDAPRAQRVALQQIGRASCRERGEIAVVAGYVKRKRSG